MSFRESIENYLRGHNVELTEKEHVYLRYLLNSMVAQETRDIQIKLNAYRKAWKNLKMLDRAMKKIDD